MTHKLAIEPIFKTKNNWFSLTTKKNVVQAKAFELGFSIKNIGNEPILGLTIRDIKFGSADGQNIVHNVEKSFHIDTLNPGTTTEIWADKFGTYMKGLTQITMRVVPDSASDQVETHQRDPFTKEVTKVRQDNSWIDFTYVESRTEAIQNDNNSLMLTLTFLMAFVTIYNLILYYRFQVSPIIESQLSTERQAKIYCQENPEGQWPKSSGGFLSCKEVIEITGKKTYLNLIKNLFLGSN